MKSDEQPLTPERLEVFLAELRKHGVVARAARVASPNAKGSCVGPFFGERERNPAFRQSWDEALLEAAGNAEHELYRRAQEGTDKPVFQRGQLVGHVREYSDRLLAQRVRALNPAYRETTKVDLNAHATLEARVTVDLETTLRELSPEAQDALFLVVAEQEVTELRTRLAAGEQLTALEHHRLERYEKLRAKIAAPAPRKVVDVTPRAAPLPALPAETAAAAAPPAPLETPATAPTAEPADVVPRHGPRLVR